MEARHRRMGWRRVVADAARHVRGRPASREGSLRVLLDELGRCLVVVLLLGAKYGERTEHRVSATTDEVDEAAASGTPVIALVQNVERSPEQDTFVARVRGTWSDGRFAPEFAGAADAGFAVVSAQRLARAQREPHPRGKTAIGLQGPCRDGQRDRSCPRGGRSQESPCERGPAPQGFGPPTDLYVRFGIGSVGSAHGTIRECTTPICAVRA